MKPTIGRIVHYVDFNKNHWPAIVTHVEEASGVLSLTVFTALKAYERNEGILCVAVIHGENEEPGTWHWPEREGA
jgi:hypothetical protein